MPAARVGPAARRGNCVSRGPHTRWSNRVCGQAPRSARCAVTAVGSMPLPKWSIRLRSLVGDSAVNLIEANPPKFDCVSEKAHCVSPFEATRAHESIERGRIAGRAITAASSQIQVSSTRPEGNLNSGAEFVGLKNVIALLLNKTQQTAKRSLVLVSIVLVHSRHLR